MLHTKFHEHRPASSGEEDFLLVFTIYGRGGHLGHVTWILQSNFRSPVSEKKIFEKCVWTTDRPRSRDDLDLN